jgi:hypothetical protein
MSIVVMLLAAVEKELSRHREEKERNLPWVETN